MKISIRKALPKDLKQLEIISNKAFPNEDVFLIVNSMIDAKHFYIAEDNEMGKIIGFIIFGIYSTKIAHIYILAIEPEYHRKGIGTILLEFAEHIINDCNIYKIKLEVRIKNIQAINFYKKHRYKIIEQISNYYDDGSDAFLMIKEKDNN